jgi:dTDP-4-amino-4,6-dideoxygalactose transaminase
MREIRYFEVDKNIEGNFMDRLNSTSVGESDKDEILDEFKSEFSNYCSSLYTVPTTTGTSALHLAICAIDLKRGDKVLCSVNSSPEVPEVVRHFDAEPIFIDIDKDSYQLDIKKLKRLLDENSSKKIKGIIVSNIAGEIADLSSIQELIDDRNIKIIEDATQSLGLQSAVESIADIRLYNFEDYGVDETANLGVFATDDSELYERAKLLSNHGIVYDEEEVDLNYIYNITDIGCQYEAKKLELLYGIYKLKSLQSSVSRRQEIAKKYVRELQGVLHITVENFKEKHSYYYFIIRIDKNRDSFARDLKKSGIETGLHYIPLHLLTYYKNKYELRVNDYPEALRTYQQVLSIPIHSSLSDSDVDAVIDNIKSLANSRV